MAVFKLFSNKPSTDEELVAKYKRSKDNRFVGELFTRYTHIVLGVSMKYLKNEEAAKDAVMDVFESLLDDLLKHEIDYFQGWLHTYVRNHCLMQLRKEKSQRQRKDQYDKSAETFVESSDGMHPSDKEILEMELETLQNAINQLKDEQKTCVELFYLQRKSYKEVSSTTGFDLKQVKSYIQNGKRNLKNIIEERG